MAGKRLVVEDEVLEFAGLNGHHSTMCGIHGRDHALTSLLQPDALLVANPSAHTATEADLFVILKQEQRPRPKPRPWANSIKRDFGYDPLLDSTGKRMKWARRLASKASC